MALIDSEGSTYSDTFDYHYQKFAETQQQNQQVVSDVLSGYKVSPQFKQAVFYNINAESSWKNENRHYDQPRFTGEASMSHGLFQEGGEDTKGLMDYAKSRGKEWTDPETQTRFVFEQNPKGKAFLQKYGQSTDWQGTAAAFASDYLAPKREYLRSRIRDIYGQQQPPRINVTPNNYPEHKDATIDRNHDVPLLAAGLMDDNGNVYGTAIDRRIPHFHTIDGITFDTSQFVHGHEMDEVKHMEENLLPGGMKSSEAYTTAHQQVATPSEQASFKKWFSSQGGDPEKGWSDYQAFWKQHSQSLESLKPELVHPHTYLHPYDGHPMQQAMEKGSGRTIANHPKATQALTPEEQASEAKYSPGEASEVGIAADPVSEVGLENMFTALTKSRGMNLKDPLSTNIEDRRGDSSKERFPSKYDKYNITAGEADAAAYNQDIPLHSDDPRNKTSKLSKAGGYFDVYKHSATAENVQRPGPIELGSVSPGRAQLMREVQEVEARLNAHIDKSFKVKPPPKALKSK